MEKETCQNCAHKDTCIQRSAVIYNLYIATGRYGDVPEAQEKMNIRPSCNNWKQRAD